MDSVFIQNIVDSYTSSKDLEVFANICGYTDDPYVKRRIFELQCQELFDLIDQDVQIPTPTTDPDLSNCSIDSTENKTNQVGFGTSQQKEAQNQSPHPGPSNNASNRKDEPTDQAYIFRKKGQKTFKKNAAIDTTYEVKFNDEWRGEKLIDIHDQLYKMFDDVLNQARGEEGDLGRVVITHGNLDQPIVIPLQNWDDLNADTVMDKITNVLNSNEELPVDDSMTISIGSIQIPSGGKGSAISSLFGPNNSLARKRSIFYIQNDNMLCLPMAIGICFLKTCKKINASEWKYLTKNDNLSIIELAMKYQIVPLWYYNILIDKNRPYPIKDMATTLCFKAGIPTNRLLGLNDIGPFEKLLNVNIMVVSSKLGNKFIRVVDNPDRTNLYVYLVESENVRHFHGIASISGFFASSFFCHGCLKAYSTKGHHKCKTTCTVCQSADCKETNLMSCRSCHRECRSNECFQRHKMPKTVDKRQKGRIVTDVIPSLCNTTYMCKTCRKNLQYNERPPEEHQCGEWTCSSCKQYQIGEHLCYQRSISPNVNNDKKFIFYDFETRQDEQMECENGYKPKPVRCKACAGESSKCASCKLCQNCRQSCCGSYQHIVNFAVMQSSCSECEDSELNPDSKCVTCGSRCHICSMLDDKGKYKKGPCKNTCGYRERVFSGDDATSQFCNHIMTEHCKNAILVAHNAKSFDLYPILEVLIDKHSVRPDKIIYSGSKIMYMHIAKQLNLTFVDSLNFLPMKLAKLPEAFGLDELCKGYFPHHFNTKENQNYIGPYPAPRDYGCDYMSSKDRKTFLEWYKQQKDKVFDFRKEIIKYCRSDVDILRRGCLEFRKIMKEATRSKKNEGNDGVDPFDYVTIAGVCMAIFRTLFLKEEHEIELWNNNVKQWLPVKTENNEKCIFINDQWIQASSLDDHLKLGKTRFSKSPIAIVPSEGYSKRDNYSKSSIEWLEWLMEHERQQGKSVQIQHALNGGEFRIPGTNYRADGYDGKTIYEFHGCVYHGCTKCYPHDRTTTTHPYTNQSMEELYVLTKKREVEIKTLGYDYICIWEHDFHQQLEKDPSMKQFISLLDVQDRLNPRDSFFGGRTNAIKLHYKVKDDETIEYYDFTSLYPWTNKYCRYPIGHPTIITSNFEDITSYFGIAKVKILPPRRLFHPVLPYTSNGKLKFPLCRTCADKEYQKLCRCSDDNRAITGTWCTPELNMAISKGYVIQKIYEIYHFEETAKYDPQTGTGGLFAEYVNTFLKIKQEASGFPDNCITEEQKLDYIRLYKENEGIDLDYENIKFNPGLRCLAKLCLNSFWGKFGQRLNMKQSQFIHESEADEFFKLISDPRKNAHDFHIIAKDIIQLEWSNDPMFIPVDAKTNIFLATLTTSFARLRLYELLDTLQQDVLYMDTDSIVFVDKNKSHLATLPIGNYLGELTNEIKQEDGYIEEFCSGGPKNYAYRTKNGSEICKVRGFTLHYTNSKLINFDSIKHLLLRKKITLEEDSQNGKDQISTKQKKLRKRKNEDDQIVVVNPFKIARNTCTRQLFNKFENKTYKTVYTKRALLSTLETVPFGF